VQEIKAYVFYTDGINIGLKKPEFKLRYIVGLSVDNRSDRSYSYSKTAVYIVDTVL
jgi:hypothetical protein